MPFRIVRDDITHMRTDAIVNAANERLRQGGGVCGAVFAAAGAREMQAACDEIGFCPTGSSVATPGFALPARHVIHTVGPVWHGGGNGEEQALASCYRTALELAFELGDESIAFPLVSSGIYGYPKDQAIAVALASIRAFLETHEMEVYLTVFDAAALRASQAHFAQIAEYIDDNYVDASPFRRRISGAGNVASAEPELLQDFAPVGAAAPAPRATHVPEAAPRTDKAVAGRGRKGPLERMLRNLDAPFSTTLLRMIDERGLKDSDVYKRANMSRQHFSKIRTNPAYKPKKQTVLALAVALELSLDETRLLLERAGFALTHADERDIIVEYFIDRRTYDIYEINLALYAFDQPLLG